MPLRRLLPLLLLPALLLGAGLSPKDVAEHQKRAAEVSRDDPKALSALAAWCLSVQLKSEAAELYRRVVELDPENAAAHKALGHVKTDGVWAAPEERKRSQALVQLRAEADKLADGDLPGMLKAAVKAEKAGAADLAKAFYERIVGLQGAHAEARRGLRQARFEDAWQDEAVLLADYVAADAEERRKALAAALKASGSPLTEERLEQHRRWASQPKGKRAGLPLEGKGWTSEYILDVPEGYTGLERLPLLIFLHGGGSPVITDPEEVHFYCQFVRPRGWISAFPKCPNQPKVGAWSEPEGEACVLNLIDKVSADYPVDPRRIYLSGMSMGGWGTLWIAARNPERFAAAAGMAAYPEGVDVKGLARLPVYLVHGPLDRQCPVDDMRNLVSQLNRLGACYKYVEIPNVGHAVSFHPEARDQLVEWISRFQSSPPPPRKK